MRDRSRSGRQDVLLMRLAFAIPATIGLVLLYYGWTNLQDARASVNWPVATGKIVTSHVETHSDSEGTSYSADIEYVYTVKGVEYASDVVVFGGNPYGAHNLVKRYPKGMNVAVSYEPADVTNAVLEPGVVNHSSFHYGIGFVLMGCLIGSGLRTLYRMTVLQATPHVLDKAAIFFFKGMFIVCFWPLGQAYRFAYPLTVLCVVLLLVVGFELGGSDKQTNQAIAVIAACVVMLALLGLMLRLMSWLSGLRDRSSGQRSSPQKARPDRIAESKLRLARNLLRRGHEQPARDQLENLLKEFPETKTAKRAEALLKRI